MNAASKKQYTEIGRKMRAIPPEKPVLNYKWEELVQKMCDSDDAGLHDIGMRELDELKQNSLANNKK